jgi:hypothetical protein
MSLSGTTALTPTAISKMQDSVAATMPGVTASQVVVTVVGGQVTTSVKLTPTQAAAFTPAAQAAFGAGLAADAGVPASNVVVSAPAAPAARRRHLLQAGAVEVPVTIVGFPPADNTSGLPDPAAAAASSAIVASLSSPTSASATALSSSGVPPGVSLVEPPTTWHHVSVSAPPAAGTDPAAAATLLQNNVASGALSAEMTRRGLAADVGAAGAFLRSSDGLRSLNPFEQYRGDGVQTPGVPPAPGSIVELRGGNDGNAFIISVAAICVAGVAFFAAAGALLRVAMLGRASVQIPRGMLDIEAPHATKSGGLRSGSVGSGERKSAARPSTTAVRGSGGAKGGRGRERDARYDAESRAPMY